MLWWECSATNHLHHTELAIILHYVKTQDAKKKILNQFKRSQYAIHSIRPHIKSIAVKLTLNWYTPSSSYEWRTLSNVCTASEVAEQIFQWFIERVWHPNQHVWELQDCRFLVGWLVEGEILKHMHKQDKALISRDKHKVNMYVDTPSDEQTFEAHAACTTKLHSMHCMQHNCMLSSGYPCSAASQLHVLPLSGAQTRSVSFHLPQFHSLTTFKCWVPSCSHVTLRVAHPYFSNSEWTIEHSFEC